MKKVILLTFAAIFALAMIGCQTTTETNSNTAIVVDDNTNTNTNLNTNNEVADADDSWDWGTNTTREDFDKDQDKYKKKAEEEKSTIGSGANDLWLWTKTRSALATTDDLRDSTINVDVEDEVVTLKGTVGTQAQKDAAVKAAKGIDGVKSVKDELKVAKDDSVTNVNLSTDDKDEKANTNTEKK